MICASVDEGAQQPPRVHDACGRLDIGKEIVVDDGYDMGRLMTHLLPLPEGRLVAMPTWGQTRACQEAPRSLTLSLEGAAIAVDSTSVRPIVIDNWPYEILARATTAGCPRRPKDLKAGDFNCTDQLHHDVDYYDLTTGRGLLHLRVLEGSVTARVEGRRATLVGKGCGETIELAERAGASGIGKGVSGPARDLDTAPY